MRMVIISILAALSFGETASAQSFRSLLDPTPERTALREAIAYCERVVDNRIIWHKRLDIPLKLRGRVVLEAEYRTEEVQVCIRRVMRPLEPSSGPVRL